MSFLLTLAKPCSGCRTNIQVLTLSSILLSLKPIVFVPLSFKRSTEDKNRAKKNIIKTLHKHECALRLQHNNKQQHKEQRRGQTVANHGVGLRNVRAESVMNDLALPELVWKKDSFPKD